jgi:hypothetical protein
MIKKSLLLLTAMAVLGKTQAQIQPCGADEMHKQLLLEHPELKEIEAEMEKQIQAGMRKIDLSTAAKKTTTDQTDNEDFWYDIPIVVHIIHDYNTYTTSGSYAGDFIPDDFIYNAVKQWNIVYAKQNPDTADVIPPFRKWIGNAHMRLHLATIDPMGNPTKGITRRRSYLTYAGGQQAKFDDWAPSSYVNIWFINKMSAANKNAAAYAHYPSSAAYIPFYDGIISLAGYMNNGSKTINHEMGHVMNLSHVWGDTNEPNVECGDDNVDDTPPTKGHNPSGCTFSALYDTACSSNYFKLYTDAAGHVELVNYPDTNNSQNIMDYTYCDKMFTKGQVRRMHIALNSDVAGRNNLWNPFNLAATGALAPVPDLKPIPDYSVTSAIGGTNYLSKNAYFTFPDKDVKFTNFSYNDTLTALSWVFTNGTSTVTSSSMTSFTQSFTEPGWVKLEMTATGNNTGDNTVTWDKALFIADKTGTVASGYLQEFDPSGDRDKWPTFNYYNNEFKWSLADVGVYDNHSIMYKGFDERVTATAQPLTGTPKGDFDDLFTVPMDLSAYAGGPCNLNFHYSGASRSSSSASISDTMLVDYTVNKGASWINLAKIGKGDLCNKGTMSTAYTPTSPSDWAARTIPLPAGAITNYTTFRFRYLPGVSTNGVTSSGNNFYMDRIHVSQWVAEASDIDMGKTSVAIVPNPTHGDALVIVNDAANTHVDITVMDITGKVVYTATAPIKGTQARITIPAAAITASGMYLVHTLTGNQTSTQKLVVY